MSNKIIEENNFYSFVYSEKDTTLIFNWKNIIEISNNDFKNYVTKYANYCLEYKPKIAAIDVREFKADLDFNVQEWWMEEIVPIYNKAGIEIFGYVTGDPKAPGVSDQTPPGVLFKMGFFKDLDSLQNWKKA
ncbi:MAG: hypothetical protein H8E70_08855 [Candidatus Marinimicrobia bacterium]|nr:hypothetical protein [Candidatus Neomarinimicrobiota bacterium]